MIGGLTAAPDTAGKAQLEIDVPAARRPGTTRSRSPNRLPTGPACSNLTVTVAEVVDSGIGVTADFPSLTRRAERHVHLHPDHHQQHPDRADVHVRPAGSRGVDGDGVARGRGEGQDRDDRGRRHGQGQGDRHAADRGGAGQVPDRRRRSPAANGATRQDQLGAEVTGTAKLESGHRRPALDVSRPLRHEQRSRCVDDAPTPGRHRCQGELGSTPPDRLGRVRSTRRRSTAVKPSETAQVAAVDQAGKDAVAGDYALTIAAPAGSRRTLGGLRLRASQTSRSWGLVGIA